MENEVATKSHVYVLFGIEIGRFIVKEQINNPKARKPNNNTEPSGHSDSKVDKQEPRQNDPVVEQTNVNHSKNDLTRPVVLAVIVAAMIYLMYNPPSAVNNIINIFKRDCAEESQRIIDLEKAISDLNEMLVGVKTEKDAVGKELERSKLRYGDCMNKNNDHQISNANLLGEIEHLKKQLQKC